MNKTDENAGGGLVALKMRAAREGEHISGAERITRADAAPETARALVARAWAHAKGIPDAVNVKIERIAAPQRLIALPVRTFEVATPEDGWRKIAELLAADGVARVDEVLARFHETHAMRGAMLLDADTLARREPDAARGVRATYMDAATGTRADVKNHFAEALVLATKVAHAPGIVAEICMSDDPDYVTGYVASRRLGYCRVTCLKEKGDPAGGRIFLFRGDENTLAECVRFLERTPVLVDGVPGTAAGRRRRTVEEELAQIKSEGLWRVTRERPAGLVNLASNDYLGLSGDARVRAAAAEAARAWGAGAGASRLVTGTLAPHARLEAHLAAFKGTEDALAWPTGYMANVGVISALARRGDVVFSDELNHASIVDGCRLSRAEVVVYRHNDAEDLRAKIAAHAGRLADGGRMLAVSDAVFSMDGDVLELPRWLAVCRAAGVMTVIDEAHATGVLGATGRGIVEHFGGGARPDVIVGTLSKALGCEGGFAAASRAVCDLLRNRARSFIFSTAAAPATAAAADAALSVLEAEPDLPGRVRGKARRLVELLRARGIAADTQSAIVPVIVGDERRAVEISRALETHGFIVPAIRYPTVARGQARLRVGVTAVTPDAELARFADVLAATL